MSNGPLLKINCRAFTPPAPVRWFLLRRIEGEPTGKMMDLFAVLSSTSMVASSRAPVAVIGATGNVGRLAVKELVEQGYPVRILQRSAAPGKDSVAASLATIPGVEPVQGDLNDAASVRLLLQGCSACLALHGAGRKRKLSDLWLDAEHMC